LNPGSFVRDEEAAGSNPATPTEKFQADGMIAKCGDHAIDHLLAVREANSAFGHDQPWELAFEDADAQWGDADPGLGERAMR
jgi:hypothetical protein